MHKREITWNAESKAANPFHSLMQELGLTNDQDEDGVEIQYTGIAGTVALAFAMGNLTGREQEVLTYRFVHGMTYDEIGPLYGVTRERIRQVEAKALRKLRGRRNVRELLQTGITGYWNKCINEKAQEIAQRVIEGYKFALDRAYAQRLDDECQRLKSDPEIVQKARHAELMATPIENLDLSVRSYNCLVRADIHTVEQLISRSYDELISIRNMGRRSTQEVMEKLHSMGLELRKTV